MFRTILRYLSQPTTVGSLIAFLAYFGFRLDGHFQLALQDLVVAAATAAGVAYDEHAIGQKLVEKE